MHSTPNAVPDVYMYAYARGSGLFVYFCATLRPQHFITCSPGIHRLLLRYFHHGLALASPQFLQPCRLQIPTSIDTSSNNRHHGLSLLSLDAGLPLFHQNWLRLLSGASCQPAIRHSRFDRRCTHNVRPVGWTCDQPGAPQNQADCKHELVSSILYLCNYFFAPTTPTELTTSGSTNYP